MMTFEELRTAVKQIPGDIKSDAVQFYFEAALLSAHLPDLQRTLEAYFGPPFKSAGAPATAESDQFSGRYGGVSTAQILYVRKREAAVDVALLWPWTGGGRITLKLIRG